MRIIGEVIIEKGLDQGEENLNFKHSEEYQTQIIGEKGREYNKQQFLGLWVRVMEKIMY